MRILPTITPILRRNPLAKLSPPAFKAVAAAVFVLMSATTSGSAAAQTLFYTQYDNQVVGVLQPGGSPGAVGGKLPSGPYGVAISADGQTLYITLYDSGEVVSLPADGSSGPTTIATGLNYPYGIAVYGDTVYVVEYNGNSGRLLSMPTDGSGTPDVLATELSSPSGVAVSLDGAYVYFVENEFLGNLWQLNPLNKERLPLATGLRSPLSLVVDGNNAYVTTNGLGLDTVYMIPLDGLPPDEGPGPTLLVPTGIAILNDTLYVGVEQYHFEGATYNCPCILSLTSNFLGSIDLVAEGIFYTAFGIAVRP